MRIGVPKEIAEGESRVALTPESVQRLVKAGHVVTVERGAGALAFAPDEAYAAAGAGQVEPGAGLWSVDLVVKVRRPLLEELQRCAPGATVVSLLGFAPADDLFELCRTRRLTYLALERVPRITRAQSMDVLSSQATVAGYKAVLLGAAELPKLLPMLTTAAGTLAPSRVFVLGAGVAGLQAIATARRLGGVVSAFDVREAAREQVQSLGATFVAAELAAPGGEAAGGYARAQSADEQTRTLEAIAAHAREVDLVVSTAQIPGTRAPILLPESTVERMRPGAVIVDLAAETGGNCALTEPGGRVVRHGVVILGPQQLPATVPVHSSQMFSRNVLALVEHLSAKDGSLRVDLGDQITKALALTHEGQVF